MTNTTGRPQIFATVKDAAMCVLIVASSSAAVTFVIYELVKGAIEIAHLI